MAKWAFTVNSWTPTAVANTVNFTDNGYMGLMGGSTTQRLEIYEVYIGGLATASAPTYMVLARDSTVQATPTALGTGQSNASIDPSTAALAAAQIAFTASTTKPQRSATLAQIAMGLNAFGGSVRWVAGPGGEFKILGNTASLGEASLSAFTGGTPGLMNASLLYETI
jgi:hypothetical protein